MEAYKKLYFVSKSRESDILRGDGYSSVAQGIKPIICIYIDWNIAKSNTPTRLDYDIMIRSIFDLWSSLNDGGRGAFKHTTEPALRSRASRF